MKKASKNPDVLFVNLPYLKEGFGKRESTGDINPPLGLA